MDFTANIWWVILFAVAAVILIVLIFLALFRSYPNREPQGKEYGFSLDEHKKIYEYAYKKYAKLNNFVQDLCDHIDEKCEYIVLPGPLWDSHRERNRFYVSSYEQPIDIVKYYIIGYIAADLSTKYDDKDMESIRKKLEQVAINLGYITHPLS